MSSCVRNLQLSLSKTLAKLAIVSLSGQDLAYFNKHGESGCSVKSQMDYIKLTLLP